MSDRATVFAPATQESHARTRVFARVIGPWLVIVPGIIVLRASGMGALASEFFKSGLFVWFAGALLLFGGLLIIAFHSTGRTLQQYLQRRSASANGRPAPEPVRREQMDWTKNIEPDVDVAAMARAQGAEAIGPIASFSELEAALRIAVDSVCSGRVFVIDAVVENACIFVFRRLMC